MLLKIKPINPEIIVWRCTIEVLQDGPKFSGLSRWRHGLHINVDATKLNWDWMTGYKNNSSFGNVKRGGLWYTQTENWLIPTYVVDVNSKATREPRDRDLVISIKLKIVMRDGLIYQVLMVPTQHRWFLSYLMGKLILDFLLSLTIASMIWYQWRIHHWI